MNSDRTVLAIAMVALLACAGCVQGKSPRIGDGVKDELTWERAKETTQARERSIATLVAEDLFVQADQSPDGVLLSCGDERRYSWNGWTHIEVKPGANREAAIKEIAVHYESLNWAVETDRTVLGNYRVQLVAPDGVENYIVAEGEPGVIRIASGSPCFALPEGAYPGGAW